MAGWVKVERGCRRACGRAPERPSASRTGDEACSTPRPPPPGRHRRSGRSSTHARTSCVTPTPSTAARSRRRAPSRDRGGAATRTSTVVTSPAQQGDPRGVRRRLPSTSGSRDTPVQRGVPSRNTVPLRTNTRRVEDPRQLEPRWLLGSRVAAERSGLRRRTTPVPHEQGFRLACPQCRHASAGQHRRKRQEEPRPHGEFDDDTKSYKWYADHDPE
jgi:hypothetical protein